MKRIVRLTENDLTRIVKRVLKESISYNGVSITPSNNGKGHLIFKSKDKEETYKIMVDTLFYEGPISVKSIWKDKNGNIKVLDNTKKTFSIEKTNILDLIKQFNDNKSELTASSSGVDLSLVRV
jgi:hypothetical protein